MLTKGQLNKGYEPPDWLLKDLKHLSRTSLSMTVATALLDHVVILGVGILTIVLFRKTSFVVSIPFAFLLAALSARQMRGLECLVHDGSHFNWTRKKNLNDPFCNLLAAWPMLSDVRSYRRTHLVHHDSLGGSDDTDLVRWDQLTLVELNREHPLQFAFGIFRRLLPYVPGWWWAIGLDIPTLIRFVVWHCGLITVLALAVGFRSAFLLWLSAWCVPYLVFLPVVRFIGEIEEHDYTSLTSIFDATYTNIGWIHKLLLHPHGDAYHTLHHLFPSIPFLAVSLG